MFDDVWWCLMMFNDVIWCLMMFNGIESFHWLWAGPRAAGTCCQMAGSLDGGGHVAPNSLHRWSNFLAAAEGSEGPESSESTGQDQKCLKWWELTMLWCKLGRFHFLDGASVWHCVVLLHVDHDWSWLILPDATEVYRSDWNWGRIKASSRSQTSN